ncbi:MAG TPA: hypothetical protein VFM02_00370 [Candidatus Paceibacterota bacterium]|nr:hypothetical protein [Candidatus Paceibacterota bacterium]
MKSTNKLLQILKYILDENITAEEKDANIRIFQEIVWDDNDDDSELDEIVSQLAYDLDFYESNEESRLESLSYYDDTKLREIVKNGIQEIEEYLKNQNEQKN